MNIDWSKAPEGATHYSSETEMFYRRVSTAEWECYVGADHGWFSSSDWRGRTTAPGFAIARPMGATWNGEGLPPVGTVCEGQVKNGGKWRPYTVKAVTDEYLIVWCGVEKSETPIRHLYWEFRAIRTAEQIEAEKRSQDMAEIVQLIEGADAADKTIAEAIYDAGYRKCP